MDIYPCIVPRRLSFDENVRAKEGGKDPSHGPLRFITSHSFRAHLCHAKNEAPEEEAVFIRWITLSTFWTTGARWSALFLKVPYVSYIPAY